MRDDDLPPLPDTIATGYIDAPQLRPTCPRADCTWPMLNGVFEPHECPRDRGQTRDVLQCGRDPDHWPPEDTPGIPPVYRRRPPATRQGIGIPRRTGSRGPAAFPR